MPERPALSLYRRWLQQNWIKLTLSSFLKELKIPHGNNLDGAVESPTYCVAAVFQKLGILHEGMEKIHEEKK